MKDDRRRRTARRCHATGHNAPHRWWFRARAAARAVAIGSAGSLGLATCVVWCLFTTAVAQAGTLTTLGPSTPTSGNPDVAVFSPDGRWLVTVQPFANLVTLFAVSPGGILTQVGPPTATGAQPEAVAFSPNSQFLATANSNADTVSIFSIGTTGVLTSADSVKSTGDRPHAVAFSHDNRVLATANLGDDSVSLFTVSAGGHLNPTGSVPTADQPVSLAFAPSQRTLVSANWGSDSVSRFTVSPDGLATPIAGDVPVGDNPTWVTFSADGAWLATANFVGNSISMLAVGPGGSLTPAGPPTATAADPSTVAFSPDGRFLATTGGSPGGRGISLYSVSTNGALTAVGPPAAAVGEPGSAFFSPSGALLATANAWPNAVGMFSVSRNGVLTPIGAPEPTNKRPTAVAVAPDGRLLATSDAEADTVSVFSVSQAGVPTRTAILPADGHPDSVAFSPDGTLLVAACLPGTVEGRLRIYSVASSGVVTPVSSLATKADPVAMAFSPDGRFIATAHPVHAATYGLISVFSVSASGVVAPIEPQTPTGDQPTSIAFSPTGSVLVTANAGGSLSVFTMSASGALTPVGDPVDTGGQPYGVAFSPDGRWLAATNLTTNSVMSYSVAPDGHLTLSKTTPTGEYPLSVVFSPDGRLLATSNLIDRTLSLFTVSEHGALTAVGEPTSTVGYAWSTAFSPDGRRLISANTGADSVSVFPLAAPALDAWITSGPPPASGSPTATFSFDANYAALFDCRLGTGPYMPCTRPTTYDHLSDGTHTFSVRARDVLGTAATVPAQWSWIVDLTAPTRVVAGSPRRGSDPVPALPTLLWPVATDSTTGVDRYELSIDGVPNRTLPASSCAATCSTTPLAPLTGGDHSWSVRAIDRVGNASDGDPSEFSVDVDPPRPFDLATPLDRAVVSSRRPLLSWQAPVDEGIGVAKVDVILDGRLVARVDTDQTQFAPPTDLQEGEHEWQIVARDRFDLQRASAAWRFTVDTTPPTASLEVSPRFFVVPFTVRLDAGGSSDPNGGRIVGWQFDVDGDGVFETTSDGPAIERVFGDVGTRAVGVRVTDASGLSATAYATIEGESPPPPPGASYVTIDDAADFTRDLLVELEIRAPARRGATLMVISNDGRPDEARKRPVATRVRDWRLARGDGVRDRRTVYVFFYNGAGVQVGERVHDEIRYDPVAPTLLAATLRRITRTRVELRLRARDSGSGLGRIEVRRSGKLVARSLRYRTRLRFSLAGSTRGVRVTLYDGAGNKTVARAAKASAR